MCHNYNDNVHVARVCTSDADCNSPNGMCNTNTGLCTCMNSNFGGEFCGDRKFVYTCIV